MENKARYRTQDIHFPYYMKSAIAIGLGFLWPVRHFSALAHFRRAILHGPESGLAFAHGRRRPPPPGHIDKWEVNYKLQNKMI